MNRIRYGFYIFCMGCNLFLAAADEQEKVMLEFDWQRAVEQFSWARYTAHRISLVNRNLFRPIKTPPGQRNHTPMGRGSDYSGDELSCSEQNYLARMQGNQQQETTVLTPVKTVLQQEKSGSKQKE
ncbi:MAG TPA: hypothetical protein VGT41_06285 [Candidatus Babeliales bacterium]|nr:hypothetical protein [Candidatus Babeliales bacterium]